MSIKALLSLAVCLAILSIEPAAATELGTAGPFRSIGGRICSSDACLPPPVDATLAREQQVRAHVARALALLDGLRVSDALVAFSDALAISPNDLQALTLRGRLSLTNGDVEAARIDIDRALSVAPQDADLLATRGWIGTGACRCDQALTDFNAALILKPTNVDILFGRALYYVGIHDTERAFTDLSASLSVAPDDVRARLLRADVQLARRDFNSATFDADKVLASDPLNFQALLIKAKARAGAGDDTGALESYTLLLDRSGVGLSLFEPQFRDAMLARARLFVKLGRFADASHDLQSILAQGGQKAILKLQLFLHDNGFPNVEITGVRSAAFDAALGTCFADKTCGPNLIH